MNEMVTSDEVDRVTGDSVMVAGEHFRHDGGSVALRAARCSGCDATVFPVQPSCPRCTGDDLVTEWLPDHGSLWSYTIQRFQPKTPYDGAADTEFSPYGVGYVQFDDRVIVEGRLTEHDPQRLRIGQTVAVVVEPYGVGEHGVPLSTFAFRPME
jgi:uncharacterized protein